jgi:carboxyl-terminal processing protease
LEGDIITAVDGKELRGVPGEVAANTLQGTVGSTVELRIQRPNSPMPMIAKITRQEVLVHSVSVCERLAVDPSIGYVKLIAFQKQTAEEIRESLARIMAPYPLKGIILDLRGNPGGLLDAAVQVADLFLDQGAIVRTQGRAWGQTWVHQVQSNTKIHLPMVLLIDGDSASASEILAAAIKDHRRGSLVGTRTYGKGSVQSIFPLQSLQTGLRLTTARFASPNNHPLEGKGVEPDYLVPRPITGTFGEEMPAPRKPQPANDPQLTMAIKVLTPVLSSSK